MTPVEIEKLSRSLLPGNSKLMFLAQHGSFLYGTQTENSDVDYKGVYIPDPDMNAIGMTKPKIDFGTADQDQKNGKGDVDIVIYRIDKFMEMTAKLSNEAIDMLHTADQQALVWTPGWDFIHNNRMKMMRADENALLGYVRSNINKYGMKGTRVGDLIDVVSEMEKHGDKSIIELEEYFNGLAEASDVVFMNDKFEPHLNTWWVSIDRAKFYPNVKASDVHKSITSRLKTNANARDAARQGEVNWKDISHAVRYCIQARIMVNGGLYFPLPDYDLKTIMAIKLGLLPFDQVSDIMQEEINKSLKVIRDANLPKTRQKEEYEELFLQACRAGDW